MSGELVKMSDWLSGGVAQAAAAPPSFEYGLGFIRINFGDWRYPNPSVAPRVQPGFLLPHLGTTPSVEVQAALSLWGQIGAYLAERE